MTFRVSKYAHNSWKIAAWDKNIKYNNYKVDYFNFYGFLIMTACVLNFTMGIHFYKEMINENKIIQEKVKFLNFIISLKKENINKWLLTTWYFRRVGRTPIKV